VRARVDHKINGALLAFKVEIAERVEHGGGDGKDALVDGHFGSSPLRPGSFSDWEYSHSFVAVNPHSKPLAATI
jgi:hypothetical protein